jgi:poly-gamma-glutamate capsule biosynthesis protein CapA/YwtB (metallophosphatase superfamily)
LIRIHRALPAAAFVSLIAIFISILGCGKRRAAPEPIELWIGGDVHVGDSDATGLAPISEALKGAFGIVNLEGPIGAAPAPGGELRLANAPSAVAALRRGGVKIAGIANNHAEDRGIDGISHTAAALRELGILPAGGPAGPAVLSINERRVVITAHDLSKGIPQGLERELEDARGRGDVLVATFHVTGPPSYLPRLDLRTAVEAAITKGALVVAAHGTHALGPVERRGQAVIAWGLGNLLFACDCTDEVDGAVLRVSIEGDTARAQIIPIDAGLRGGAARPSHNPSLILDLFDALGSSPLRREGLGAWL